MNSKCGSIFHSFVSAELRTLPSDLSLRLPLLVQALLVKDPVTERFLLGSSVPAVSRKRLQLLAPKNPILWLPNLRL